MAATGVKWNWLHGGPSSELVGHYDYVHLDDAEAHVELLAEYTPRGGAAMVPLAAIEDDDVGAHHRVRVELRAPLELPFTEAKTLEDARSFSVDEKLELVQSVGSFLENVYLGNEDIHPLLDPSDVLVFPGGGVLVLRVYDGMSGSPTRPRGFDIRHAPIEYRKLLGRGQRGRRENLVWTVGRVAAALGLDQAAVTRATDSDPRTRFNDVELFMIALREEIGRQRGPGRIVGPQVEPTPKKSEEREPEPQPEKKQDTHTDTHTDTGPPPDNLKWAIFLIGLVLAAGLLIVVWAKYWNTDDPKPEPKPDPGKDPTPKVDSGLSRPFEIAPAGARANVLSRQACRVDGVTMDCLSSLVLDGRHDTAWCFPADTEGQPVLELQVPTGVEVVGLYLTNGYQKSRDTWSRNGRLKEVEVRGASGSLRKVLDHGALSGRELVSLEELDLGRSVGIAVLDTAVPQGAEDVCLTEIKLRVKRRN